MEKQVERVLGRALSQVEGVDFSVQIERQERRRWRLDLTTHSRNHKRLPRERELLGQTCAEVTEAAAVAIAMAVSHPEPEPEPEEPASIESEPEPDPQPPQPPAAPPQPETDGPNLRFSTSAGLLLDSSALPAPALGAGLELSAHYRALRVSLSGALFAPQETRPIDDRAGGRFGLWSGGLSLCFQPTAEGLFAMGCAGFELGQVSAEGVGLDENKPNSSLWQALRAEFGLGYRLNGWVAAIARLGGVVPLEHTEFYVDGDQQVHVLPSLSVRAALGIELYL